MIEIQEQIIIGLGNFFAIATLLMPLMGLMWSLLKVFTNGK